MRETFASFDVPTLPKGWDVDFGPHDFCPIATNEDASLVLFIQHPDPAQRESDIEDVPRFMLYHEGDGRDIAASEDWAEMLDAIKRHSCP
jgi:hypothetical protein